MVKIYPSLLSADFFNLEKDIEKVINVADGLHMDVMDGNFVPNISFGNPIIKSVKQNTKIYLDTHLMIENPEKYIDDFSKYSDSLTIHYEATNHLDRTINAIKEKGIKAGVSINPHTSIYLLENILKIVDSILIMSVNPGFGGQSFIEYSYDKIQSLKEMIDMKNLNVQIQVDGGVNKDKIKPLYDAGAREFISGSAIFKSNNPEREILLMKEKVK
ncbi:MAG: ribulose-phosphate 3-epimerase [Thermotogota bacterium]